MVGSTDRTVLEREHELAVLADAARRAAGGEGRIILIHGEAGIGKSRIVQAARGLLPAEGRVLVGHCDDLATARPLGPFHDLVDHVGTELATALRTRGIDRDAVLSALRFELDHTAHPALLAVEDVHWADEATLDVLLYLVRRISQLPVVLVLTYRDDEVAADHPMQRVLGQAAATGSAVHLPLRRLSPQAVDRLVAASSLDADEVYKITAGNPFFVREVLATGDAAGVPRTVVAAVMARVHDLPADVRAAVEQLAVLPNAGIARSLVERLVPGGLPALEPAEERGLLTVTPSRVSFRHELGRRAILNALPAARKVRCNAAALDALATLDDVDVTQILHHAAEAGDRRAVVEYGPRAAREAASCGAHREAVAHYRLVLEHVESYPSGEHAALLTEYAAECHLVGRNHEAAEGLRCAVDLWRVLDDRPALGDGLVTLSQMLWLTGDSAAAHEAAEDAVTMLVPLADDRRVALASSNRARLLLLAYRTSEAVELAERATELARAGGDPEILSHALNSLGASRWELGYADARQVLQESLDVALAAGAVDSACRAYLNLTDRLIDHLQLVEASRFAVAGAEFANRAEHLTALAAFGMHRARILLAQGSWAEAGELARAVDDTDPIHHCVALLVLGRIAARRGAPEGQELLARSVALARRTGDVQLLAWTTAAAAEDAWLRGDRQGVVDIASEPFEQTHDLDAAVLWPELAYWLIRAGVHLSPRDSSNPFALLVRGDWRSASAIWDAAGCRYEYALALSESDSPDELRTALDVLDRLGARPLAQTVRRRLRDLGVTRIPRGPAATTLNNPAGLTARQLEVLRLLGDGLTDAAIAARLVVSVRTASNHVAAVLARLGVSSRREAAERWSQLSSESPRSE